MSRDKRDKPDDPSFDLDHHLVRPRRRSRDDLPMLLRIGEAADELGCSIRAAQNLADSGVLERVRFGPKFSRITAASVLAQLSQLSL